MKPLWYAAFTSPVLGSGEPGTLLTALVTGRTTDGLCRRPSSATVGLATSASFDHVR